MRRSLSILLTLAVLVAGFRLVSACLTIEPVVVEKDAKGVGNGECLRCIEEPATCAGLIDECRAKYPACGPAFECIRREACFDLLTLDDKINCGLPCAQDAGIVSAADPVVSTYLVGLVACAQQKCALQCNLSDAGIGL